MTNQIKSKIKFASFNVAPDRQFKRLLIISTTLFLGIAFYSFLIFNDVRFSDAKKYEGDISTPMPKIDQNKLNSVLLEYKQKAEYQNAAINLIPMDLNPGK